MTKVYVYFNLHNRVFSVLQNGKLLKHSTSITLKNVEFRVRQGGRKRVLSEKRKNVHAFVVGEISRNPVDKVSNRRYNVIEAYYNPYLCDSFVKKQNKEPIHKAEFVKLVVVDKKPYVYALEAANEI